MRRLLVALLLCVPLTARAQLPSVFQSFTVPAGASELLFLQFTTQSGANFRVDIYEFDGVTLVGPSLFTAGPNTPYTIGSEQYWAFTPHLSVIANHVYAAALTDGGGSFTGSRRYSGGNAYLLNNGVYRPFGNGGDFVDFYAEFQTDNGVVNTGLQTITPEPGAWLLMLTGLAALLLYRRHASSSSRMFESAERPPTV